MEVVRIIVWDDETRLTIEARAEREAVLEAERLLRQLGMGVRCLVTYWVEASDVGVRRRITMYLRDLAFELAAEPRAAASTGDLPAIGSHPKE